MACHDRPARRARRLRQELRRRALRRRERRRALAPRLRPWALAAGSRRGGQRIDRKAGTIESDDAYLAFLEALDTPTAAQAATEPATAGLGGPKDAVVVTPLMAYLRDKERKNAELGAEPASCVSKPFIQSTAADTV